ncbi:type III pantothenate kinase, partial [bacterium]
MSMNKSLLIDIGNSNIVLGLSEVAGGFDSIECFRFSTDANYTVDELGMKMIFALDMLKVRKDLIQGALVSSVVPQLDNNVKDAIKKYIGCKSFFITDFDVSNIVSVKYKNVSEIGADRLVNTKAGISLYGSPLVIVDIGTAVTLDVINKKAEYIGGTIFPGIGISIDALAQRTSKLPNIDFKYVDKVIGINTVQSIQAGIYYGFLGSIKYLIQKVKEEQNMSEAQVVLTGGYTDIYENEKDFFDIFDANLAL